MEMEGSTALIHASGVGAPSLATHLEGGRGEECGNGFLENIAETIVTGHRGGEGRGSSHLCVCKLMNHFTEISTGSVKKHSKDTWDTKKGPASHRRKNLATNIR